MSLSILRSGLLDSIQDHGRYGFRQWGINPGGVMDPFASALANILVGNPTREGVIEIHFPASAFHFESSVVIALAGADFDPRINGESIPLNTPLWIRPDSTLTFVRPRVGARCYLAVGGGWDILLWLGSTSTHLKAHVGGYQGRKLLKGDILPLHQRIDNPFPKEYIFLPLANAPDISFPDVPSVLILKGHEFNRLDEASRHALETSSFTMSVQSDRMGYRLTGPALHTQTHEELVSSPVTFGTLQLLPDGSLIVLMADHQTTGGYPRIGTVISAHHSRLAQMKPGETLRFQITDIRTAEQLWILQQKQLESLQPFYANIISSFFASAH